MSKLSEKYRKKYQILLKSISILIHFESISIGIGILIHFLPSIGQCSAILQQMGLVVGKRTVSGISMLMEMT